MLTINRRSPTQEIGFSSHVGLSGGRFYRLAVMAVGGLFTSAALAVTLSPVKVMLSRTHPVVTITVTNDADVPLILQNQVLAWTQVNGKDYLEDSTDLLVAPVIAEIEPRATQIFRVRLRYPTVAVAERAYRLVLDDISAIEHLGEVSGLNFVFSHRLPVFVAGSGHIGPQLRLDKCVNSAAQGCMRLINTGDQHVQMRGLSVQGRDWQEDLSVGNRILAGSWRQWTFVLPPASVGRLTVTAETSAGQMRFDLPNPLP